MRPGSEAKLILRCRRGEPEAWNELFDANYAAVGRFLFQLSPDFSHEDVEEISQEVFLSVIRNLHTFQGASQLQTWIFRIAVNKSRDFRERQLAAKRGGGQVPISLQAPGNDPELTLDPPSPEAGPDAALVKAEERALVREALARLGDPCREVIELRYFGDLSYEEISRVLHLNEKTVSSRLSKCLDRLETIARPIFAVTPPATSLPPGLEKTEPFSV